jgi:phenylacetate-coenzyme A ligase PaaK-like adenylate-forming protein
MRLRVRTLFALLDLRSRGAFSKEYDLISRSQWESPDRVRELQLERLRSLVGHAERHVPFYQRRFAEHGIRASDIKDLRDFERIPPLEKAEVLANAEALLSTDRRRSLLTRKATGGSTGERMVFYRDAEAMARNFAHVLRNHTWTGLELGDSHAFLWGAHFDLRVQQQLSNRVVNLCLKQRWMDAFHMSRSSMLAYHGRLGRWKPGLLSAYVTAASTLGDFILDAGLPRLEIPAVATSAEVLFPERRARILETLGRAVFDRLGCREIGNTAHECAAHDGLHVNAEHTLLELVDGSAHAVLAGMEGEILYTSLGNWCFPLIRYRVGDYAVGGSPAAPCSCGRGLPKISQVRGRVTDMLTAPNGTKIHGEYFSHLFYQTPAVAEFRVVQESLERIAVWVRARDAAARLPAEQEALLRSEFSRVFGPGVEVAIEVVDEIPKTASGKHRFTESRLTEARS